MSGWREVLAELRYHGFTVSEPPAR